MRAKEYQLLDRCVEEGIERGYRLAHKHTENPHDDQIHEAIHSAVMGEIVEWFEFEEGDE